MVQRPVFMSIPGVKNDLSHCLRVPVSDLLLFLRAQFPAKATPVLIQLVSAQKVHRAFRQLDPVWLSDPDKSAGGVPPGKGCVGVMDILQDENGIIITADFCKVEVL